MTLRLGGTCAWMLTEAVANEVEAAVTSLASSAASGALSHAILSTRLVTGVITFPRDHNGAITPV